MGCDHLHIVVDNERTGLHYALSRSCD